MLYRNFDIFLHTIPQKGRLLGLDISASMIGLSFTDHAQTIASPYKTLIRSTLKKNSLELISIVNEFHIQGMIVGFPLELSGQEGRRCQAITDYLQAFLRTSPEISTISIGLWDERFSTQIIEKYLITQADMTRKKRKKNIDKMAASYILQGALNYMHHQRRGINIPS